MSVALLIAGLMLMTLLHELGHAAAARALGMRVQMLSVGFGPALAQAHWRGVEVLLCIIPFGGFVRVAELSDDDPQAAQGRVHVASRLAVIVAGSTANYLIAGALGVALTLGWGVDTGSIEGLEVTMVSEHAAKVGLAVGDVVVRADSRSVQSVEQLQARFAAAGEAPVRLEVTRAGAPLELLATAAGKGRAGLGARYVPRPQFVAASWLTSLRVGLLDPFRKGAAMLRGAAGMFSRGRASRPASPIGVATRVSQSGRWDLRRVLSFAAILSVAVGVFNLLPLPGLDGGRVCLAVGETVARRKLRPRVAMFMQLAGATVLMAAWLAIVLLDLFAMGR